MLDFHKIESEILEFWEKEKIFEKVRKKNKGGRRWSFIDGPITANNPMGVHHAWGRTYKDLFHRLKAMQGFEMRYQNGFDCQGLWVEREEEKDLGLKNKEDIEKFGILNFVKACRKRVEKFSKIQRDQSIRLGQWMDWENSYYTMTDKNNLHNWHLLKNYFDRGWLYKGKDAVPWCWRCGTASSKHDIATEGYKEVTHSSVFMQFPLKDKPTEYFLIWTTTPWTIPANVAIAVNPNLDYVKADVSGVFYWLAESRLEELDEKYKIVDKKKGSELKGMEYLMPYAHLEEQRDAPHKVVLWEMASGEDGTGIVHIAPGCGAEDFDLGKKEHLPAISPLDDAGIYKEGYAEFSLKKYSDVNKAVLEDLEQRRFVYKIEPIKHRYPHCWRCGEELVFRTVDEWYVKGKEMRAALIRENKKIKWYPEYGKKRQEEWFKNMGDWLISRKRYWGLPLPIWECSCGKVEVIGDIKELRKKAVDKKKVDKLPEIHRPWIDEIEIKCGKCGKNVKRIEDVGDAWLDAGIVMFSTLDYLDNKEYWKKWYPADLISENMPGQYRGWFNAIMWAGVALTGKTPFKAMFGYETLKDEKGEEMHKSKGNAIWFDDAVEKIGADAMRLLYCLQEPAQELRFGFNAIKEPKNNLNILYNLSKLVENSKKVKINSAEDKWILSRFNSLVKKVTEDFEDLHPHQATRALQDFWLNDLSRGYIQFVRDRLAENDEKVKMVLREIYTELLKMCAPICPFLTEHLWQSMGQKEQSVHLCKWPKFEVKKIDKKLEESFDVAMKIIEKGLAERDRERIGLRWPLSKAVIKSSSNLGKELGDIIARQLNVKKVEVKIAKGNESVVEIDTKITPELEAEGFAREVARKVQAERKKAGLKKGQLIELKVFADDKVREMLSKWEKFLKERTNSKKIEFAAGKGKTMFEVREREIGISFTE
ncbi:MAG: isoleucine--tRNA ligase [Nanoarchaeota archaeon]|nr:isoleucine--tRNA ligase [Nanoarchaeota archaeon]MBU1104023.1 isoleucine--tRNA ligase [Nanoarchaeota archaeon]